MAEHVKRTQYSMEGLDFVVLFSSKFLNVHVSGYKPLLMEPTESTGGGKQATQHIVLKPQLDGDPLLTVGSVNVAIRSAKLRTYDCMASLHALRFSGRPFHVDKDSYQSFFERALAFLQGRGMQVQVETRPPGVDQGSPAPRSMSTPARSQDWIWLAALVVVCLVGVGAYLLASGRVSLPF